MIFSHKPPLQTSTSPIPRIRIRPVHAVSYIYEKNLLLRSIVCKKRDFFKKNYTFTGLMSILTTLLNKPSHKHEKDNVHIFNLHHNNLEKREKKIHIIPK